MASDGRVLELRDVVSLASGGTPSKQNAAFWGKGVPWVSAKDMGRFWIDETEDQLTDAGVAKSTRVVPEGTVLILTRGMTLHKRVPICRVRRRATFNQDVKAALPKQGVSPRFLPYLMTGNHDRLHSLVDSAGHGTGRINTPELLSLKVWIPELPEQEAIGEIGEAIDDRIDLLRQTNATLEAIAQALFKSWFVDFDPVRAKAEGRELECMDAATAALFPDEFEESELGLIPQGWRAGRFGDIALHSKGSVSPLNSPEVEYDHYSLPAFDAGQLPVREFGEAIKSNKTPIPNGAVLISKLNPHIPRIWFTGEVGQNAVCSTEFLVWKPAEGTCAEYVFCLAASTPFNESMRQLVTGTSNSHQRVKPDDLAAIATLVPPPAITAAFESIARPLLRRVLENRSTAQSLAQLRDTLIPRLISGKLRLSEAEEEREDALA